MADPQERQPFIFSLLERVMPKDDDELDVEPMSTRAFAVWLGVLVAAVIVLSLFLRGCIV